MLTATDTKPTTTDQDTREWGFRVTWTDGHSEIVTRESRLSAETGASLTRRPGRTTEAVYRMDEDSPWEALPALSDGPDLRQPRPLTVRRIVRRMAGGAAEFLGAALAGVAVYLWLKSQGSI